MQNADLIALTAMLIAVQFAAFGWRIVREIAVAEEGRKIWLPVPDVLNIVSITPVVLFGIVLPLAHDKFSPTVKPVLAVGFVLIAFHPLSMACHYCIFSKNGRETYKTADDDWPYFPPPEIFCVVLSLLVSTGVGWYVAR